MPVELTVPFHLTRDGRVSTVSDPDRQVRQHVFSLVNTYPPERVTVPGYGVPLFPLLFETMDGDEVAVQVQALVPDAMATWEPGVELTEVKVNEDETGGNVAVVEVFYARRDAADSGVTANTNTAVIGATGTVREIVRG